MSALHPYSLTADESTNMMACYMISAPGLGNKQANRKELLQGAGQTV